MREVGGEIYYDVTNRDMIVMDARRKEVIKYIHGIVSNLYRNYFIKFKDQNS